MSEPELLFTSEGPIAFVTFNRPQKRNAMTWSMYEALQQACERVDQDEQVRVLVLRARGEAFMAGTDIRQFASFSSGADGLTYERRLDAVLERLEGVRVPTVAQVEGVAAGGGCLIALACDLRVCTPEAQFGVPVARTLGNCLSGANYARLVSWLGPARTKDLLFTGRFLEAAEAERLGLVTVLAASSEADTATRDLGRTLVKNARSTMHATKVALRRLAAGQRERLAIDDLVAECYASDDFREGVAAFLERRAPRFTER